MCPYCENTFPTLPLKLIYEPLKIQENLTYVKKLVRILDKKEHELHTKKISLLKLWRNNHYREEEIQYNYPHLFEN